SYLVTGGLGALGLKAAGWLAEHGAGHLVLTSRREAGPEARRQIEQIQQRSGCIVHVRPADVSDAGQVQGLLGWIRAELPELRGLIHAAGVLDDGVIQEQAPARFATVLQPKAYAAFNLHRAAHELPLAFFVLSSSVRPTRGSAGQSNSAAASPFLDSLAPYRRASGLPAVSINWGPWAEVGMAARLAQPADRRRVLGV